MEPRCHRSPHLDIFSELQNLENEHKIRLTGRLHKFYFRIDNELQYHLIYIRIRCTTDKNLGNETLNSVEKPK